jgi:hypothetical protein
MPATTPVWLAPEATVAARTTLWADVPLLFMYEALTYRSVGFDNL